MFHVKQCGRMSDWKYSSFQCGLEPPSSGASPVYGASRSVRAGQIHSFIEPKMIPAPLSVFSSVVRLLRIYVFKEIIFYSSSFTCTTSSSRGLV